MNGKLLKENSIKTVFFITALASIGIVLLIVFYMVYLGYPAIIDWFTHGFMSPNYLEILPFAYGSIYLALGGTILGIAIGVPCAIYLAEFADQRLRNVIKPTLEVLNGFPSVVIGILGFTLICTQFGRFGIQAMYCFLAGWIVLGIMCLPLIASVSEDSLRAVPQDLREASLGLGATRWQTTTHVLIPGASSGILTAIMLAFADGIGETMAVLVVIGLQIPPPITLDPLARGNAITSLIANGYQETSTGSPQYIALFGAGFVLFIITGVINFAVRRSFKRKNQQKSQQIRGQKAIEN